MGLLSADLAVVVLAHDFPGRLEQRLAPVGVAGMWHGAEMYFAYAKGNVYAVVGVNSGHGHCNAPSV